MIFYSRNRGEVLLGMIKEELERYKGKPEYILFNRNAYSILYRYIDFNIEPVESDGKMMGKFTVFGIEGRVTPLGDDRKVDYFEIKGE